MEQYEKAVALWRRRKITTDAELAEALNGHSIAFAYHSGKIENEHITYNDTREIFERDGVTSYTGDLRTLFEIRNAKEANELYLEDVYKRQCLYGKQSAYKNASDSRVNSLCDNRRGTWYHVKLFGNRRRAY